MKKKKLKKRIKRLEKENQTIADKTSETLNAQHQVLCALRDRISTLDDSITRNDQSYRSQFGTIKNSVREIRNMVDVLNKRTTTDYTQFSKPIVDTSKGPDTVFVTGEKIEESPTPPCEACKWHGLTNSLADSPCFGCTVGDYKMYEPKEEI